MSDSRGTILVADDEEILLRLVTRVLERAGYRVQGAHDGLAARRILESGAALDAVVLDASLAPDGALALFDALDGASGAPGLVVTGGEAPPEEVRLALEARGGRFVAKPFSPALLLEAVEAVRDRGRS